MSWTACDPRVEPSDAAKAEVPPDSRRFRPPVSPPSLRQATGSGEINIRVNQDQSGGDQNETVLAVNPNDPLHLVGGAIDFRLGTVRTGFYASQDGGLTWNDGLIFELNYEYQADPAVAFCADGSVVFTQISYDGIFAPNGLYFSRSTDGGQSWPIATAVVDHPTGVPFADKEWITCDTAPGSPYTNRIYVTWTEIAPGEPTHFYRIASKSSSDFGASWNPTVNVSDGTNVQASVVALGPEGQVYVAWNEGWSTWPVGRPIPGRIGPGPRKGFAKACIACRAAKEARGRSESICSAAERFCARPSTRPRCCRRISGWRRMCGASPRSTSWLARGSKCTRSTSPRTRQENTTRPASPLVDLASTLR